MNILLIDNDSENLQSVEAALRLNGYSVQGFNDLVSADSFLRTGNFDIIISDFHLASHTRGSDIFDILAGLSLSKPVILMSGNPDINIDDLKRHPGFFRFFSKPINIIAILEELKRVDSI